MEIIKGRTPGPSEDRTEGPTFTGRVWGDNIYTGEGVTANSVAFLPGGRTHWHHHEHGQLLIVTHGRGWVFNRDGEGAELTAGDMVWTPSGEDHWHGAASDSLLVHVAVSIGSTNWLEEVTRDEFDRLTSAAASL